jgi:hypothetical protein
MIQSDLAKQHPPKLRLLDNSQIPTANRFSPAPFTVPDIANPVTTFNW